MISADIPMTINSTANLSLSIPEFIEYSIKNDLNIVTTKWLAHVKKISISEAKAALMSFWDSIGKVKGFCATFSVLSMSETENCFYMELIDFDKLESEVKGKIISSEIYAIHAVPLKDKSVQLGMINAPIFDLTGDIVAPWIESKNEIIINTPSSDVINTTATANTKNTTTVNPMSSVANEVASQPPEKKMKIIQKTRTFMHDGYQQVETYNELVPCDDEEMTDKPVINALTNATQTPSAAPAQTKSKQSSMMSFFKKK